MVRECLRGIVVFVFSVAMGVSPSPAIAESEFADGERFIEEVVVEGIPISTAIAFAPDSRIFIALKDGVVRVVQNGQLLPTPFLDIKTIVNKSTDRGLLGIAVDPNFPSKPYVYLSYVWDPPGFTPDSQESRLIRVVRYAADAAKGYNVAIAGSEEVILGKNSLPQYIAPPATSAEVVYPERASCMTGLTMEGNPIEDCLPVDSLSHTAGSLMFGADGTLVASLGDGANYDYPSTTAFRAQNLDAMSGRVVRVDPDTGYGVPGNPYFDPTNPSSNRSKVWSIGYRNPFRFTINPANGQVYVGDVGTSYYEEINAGKGGNFGWPCYEGGFSDRSQQEGQATISERQVGFKRAPATIDFCNQLYAKGAGVVTPPVFAYRHPYDENGKDLGSSITGVAFYAGTAYPERYRGALFFADYARFFIKYLTFDSKGTPTVHEFAKETGSNFGAVQLISGPDSNIYAVYLDLKTRTGNVRRFRPMVGSNNPPSIKANAGPLLGATPLVVSFSSAGSADPDGQQISFSWDFGDGESSTEADPVHVYTKVGTYKATLTVKEMTAPFATSTKSFTIRTGANPPVAFIDSPGRSYRYEIGKRVTFSGRTEPSTGVDMTWVILQKHNLHEHLVAEVSGPSGSFVPEEHCDNCSYELCLSAQGQGELIDQKCIPVPPNSTQYTLASKPPGASIAYVDEDKEVLAPYVAQPIVGSRQTISANVISNGRTFVRWSDGVRDPVRTFVTGTEPKTFRAIYANRPPVVSVKSIPLRIASPAARARTIKLHAKGSRDPEGEPLRFSWKFSDGRSVRGSSITRTFKRVGSYGVTLTVRDRIGGAAVYRGTVKVGGAKPALRRIRSRATVKAYDEEPQE
jgi:glucose/arabinose dehydrogenase